MDFRTLKGEVPYGRVITRCKIPKTIALTYDDGPSEYTDHLLDILHLATARATFFLSGNTNSKGEIDITAKWVKAIKRMDKDGHQIASHTWSHPDLDEIPSEARKDELSKNERAIANILNKYPTYMRPPYLKCNQATGCLDDMKTQGYHVIGYTLDSTDWLRENDLDAMIKAVDDGFHNIDPNEGNVLMIQHDTIQKSAIDLTKYILEKVKKMGWRGRTQFLHSFHGDTDC